MITKYTKQYYNELYYVKNDIPEIKRKRFQTNPLRLYSNVLSTFLYTLHYVPDLLTLYQKAAHEENEYHPL